MGELWGFVFMVDIDGGCGGGGEVRGYLDVVE